jgi:hypothetical protein
MTAAERWPTSDRVRWVEERLKALVAFKSGQLKPWVVVREKLPRKSMEVWLAKERDKVSWQRIVINHFPQYIKAGKKGAGISKARRVHLEVERALEPSTKQLLREHLEDRIKDLFACTPRQFKSYLESIRTRKLKKS